MERAPSSSRGREFMSCGKCLKLKLRWKSKAARRSAVGDVATTTFYPPTRKQPQRANRVVGFKYDPLSYAQNFDDSAIDDVDEEEFYSHGFTSRFAAPSKSKSPSSASGATHICVN